jgi:hypothetical protein
MTTTAPLPLRDRMHPASPQPVDPPIVVVFDPELAQRLHEATGPLPVDPPRQERPPARREAFQYD